MRRVENHLDQRTAGLIHQCACNWDFKWPFMTPFKRFKWKTFSNVSIPALAARAPERKVGPKLTITLANLHQIIRNCNNFSLTNSFTFSLTCFLDNPLAYSFTNVLAPFLTGLLTYQIMKRPKVMHWGLSLTRRATSSSSSSGRMGASFKITDKRFTWNFRGWFVWRINLFLFSSVGKEGENKGCVLTLISFAWLDIHEWNFILLRNGIMGKENITSAGSVQS